VREGKGRGGVGKGRGREKGRGNGERGEGEGRSLSYQSKNCFRAPVKNHLIHPLAANFYQEFEIVAILSYLNPHFY